MKFIKTVIITLLVMAILLAGVFLAGRYGWKVFGFRACEEAAITSVEVGENAVTIRGFYPGSFPRGFCGYYAEELGGKLDVGFRFSAVFGFFETGDFAVTIPVEREIDEVIHKTGAGERSIWEEETVAAEDPEDCGVYVRLERSDVSSIYIRYDDVTDGFGNADGTQLEAGQWLFTGGNLAAVSRKDNRAVPFTVGALAADGSTLAEGTFFYDAAQEKLYVTIAADGVSCSASDAPGAPADVAPVLTLPILDDIDENVIPGISGSSLRAVQVAVRLLDWGVNTGLGADEIGEAASTWLAAKGDDLPLCIEKLELVDNAYQRLLTEDADELLDVAGCADIHRFWGSEPVESIEAIMQAAGLRG